MESSGVGVVGALDPPNMEKKLFPGGSCDSEADGVGELSSCEFCLVEPPNIESSPPPGVSVVEVPGRMPPRIDDPVCKEFCCDVTVAPPNIENKPLLGCSLRGSGSGWSTLDVVSSLGGHS